MTRAMLIAIAAGGLVTAGASLATRAEAQSGDALAHAERACMDFGVRPYTESFNVCVSRVSSDFDQGRPELAYREARAVVTARDTCAAMGAQPHTMGYRQCINTEIDRQTRRGLSTIRYVPAVAPPTAS